MLLLMQGAAASASRSSKVKKGEIYVDDSGKRSRRSVYFRGGEEISTWHEVDVSGSRILGGSVRQPDTPAEICLKMTEAQHMACCYD